MKYNGKRIDMDYLIETEMIRDLDDTVAVFTFSFKVDELAKMSPEDRGKLFESFLATIETAAYNEKLKDL